MLFQDRLKQWRGARLQKEAAAELDVPLGTYRKWEYGKRTPGKFAIETLNKLMESKPDQK